MTVATPVVLAVTSPEEETVATKALLEDHATDDVISSVEPFERMAVATSCLVEPSIIEAELSESERLFTTASIA